MLQHSIFRFIYILYGSVFLLHLVNVILIDGKLDYVMGVLAILLLLISYSQATRLFKILGAAFIVVGTVTFILSGRSYLDIPEMMTSNMSVLVLLAMLPWMNSAVRVGGFDKTLTSLLEANVKDLGKLYSRSSMATLVLASFLNLSSVAISQDVLKENLSAFPKQLRNSFISTATLRGFTLALLWSPLELLLAVSIFTTDVDYVEVLPWLLIIAAATFTLDSIWGRFAYRKQQYEPAKEGQRVTKKTVLNLLHLVGALAIFLLLVIVLGNWMKLGFLLAVAILIFPFALLWTFAMNKGRMFLKSGWETWKEKTNSMQNFVVLFISLSFFGNSLNGSNFIEVLENPVFALAEFPLVIFVCIQFFFIFMSLFGVHPVATIGILSGVISILVTIMNPVSIALVLITSSIATLTVGTYGLVVTMTSVNMEQSPYRITVANMPFALLYGFIGSLLAYFLL